VNLVRYGAKGSEKPGIIDNEGNLRCMSAHVEDIGPGELAPEGLARIASIDIARLPIVTGEPRFGIPFHGTRKFIAVGLNFADHAEESGLPIPSEPVLFTKAISCLHGPNDDILLPPGSTKTDWEVELGIVIGTKASYVDEQHAMEHVAGYCVVNDVSEREYQLEREGTWDKGNGCDTFGPVGPWFVTADAVPNPHDLDMWLDVNGERMQDGSTRTMIFGVPVLVSYISKFMTLEPGDIITTGTPPGVGLGQKPPRYLKAGDEVRLGIEKLGQQQQRVASSRITHREKVGQRRPSVGT
jgi:2-keto-4-pentenoate hydratase/2-oxohepta-3-ene-1,7-dioic acid hydratase in catechol pathway